MKKMYFLVFVFTTAAFFSASNLTAQVILITSPGGPGQDGKITVLTNGNYLVTDPWYSNGGVSNLGAVYLYNGSTHALISTLKGSTQSDHVGSGDITPLNNGNYVIKSPGWNNGAATAAGAVTFGSGSTGVNGVVGSGNSLVGTASNDSIGNKGVTGLSNGNYVVRSSNWNNGAATAAGAITWCNGTSGRVGLVSTSNSLIGNSTDDFVGSTGVTAFSNGHYVVSSCSWNNGVASAAGAVTWCNGTTGRVGVVSSSNSLVGSTADDQVGNGGITALTNGSYVVKSSNWDNFTVTDAGAVTFCIGTGLSGIVSNSNSLVGSTANDQVGSGGITALTNGNYVVNSYYWDNGTAIYAGAVTFCIGTGLSGIVSNSNSLVGRASNDHVGSNSVTALNNGNYVVSSENWKNGAATAAGAVTFGNGIAGISGVVTSSNSLVGGNSWDQVGMPRITPLATGNYVVCSETWHNGVSPGQAGAVTLCSGIAGRTGLVSINNSLVGNSEDVAGHEPITILTNGNYVVNIPMYDNGTALDAGAATFCSVSGTTTLTGLVTNSNSLVGSTENDGVGLRTTALANGNYVVNSEYWNNGIATLVGAITWCNGTTGRVGVVSTSNSLVGSTADDQIGNGGITALTNGNYVVGSSRWDNGTVVNAGAATFGSGTAGVSGVVSSTNSLVGSTDQSKVGIITGLTNGNYVVDSPDWGNGAGAITLGNGSAGTSGIITSCNSVLGNGTVPVFAYNTIYDYLIVGQYSVNAIYYATGMTLANSLDASTVNINGNNVIPLIENSVCRLIATLTPNGGAPVSGTVNAKAWIEPAVPTHAGNPFVARHIEINPVMNASTATAKTTLYFTQQEFTDFNNHAASALDLPTGSADAIGIANLRVAKYAGPSSNGTGLPGSYSGTSSIIDPIDADIVWNSKFSRWEVSFNVTGFSGFIVQTFATVLPSTLLEFNGRLQNNNAVLNWKTTSELNAHSFDVERSSDGRNYGTVGNVAAFNTTGDHQYNFTDNNIHLIGAPIVYYRLKQKDTNGSFKYSTIVALSIDDRRNKVLFYPNPVTTEANLTITVNKPQQVQARILDNTGRVIKQMQWDITADGTAIPIDVKRLAKGMYYLELISESINERKVFVKQ